MISFFVGTLGAIIALVGWFGFHAVIPLLIGTALYIIETIMEWERLNFNAKIFDIVIFTIGSVIAIIYASAPWYVGGMIAIAIYNLILSVIGIVEMFTFLQYKNCRNRKDK